MNVIVSSVLWIGGIGLACGLVLSLATRYFAVAEDPRVEMLAALLPGANCGGCGFAGCAAYAAAMAAGTAPVNLCAPGGATLAAKLAETLGVAAAEAPARRVAVVLCGGDDTRARKRFLYNGLADCAAAAAVAGGDKACEAGCLGYGTCRRVCPVNAIGIGDGLARVRPDLCIGCGRCVAACPRRIIRLVPAERRVHVLCSSKAPGAVVRKVCAAGCIGCRLCVKIAGDAVTMDGFLAVVNYDPPPKNADEVIARCPAKCIREI